MANKKIEIDIEFCLSPVTVADIPQLITGCNNDEVFNNTLRVPKPYTETDARRFLTYCEECRLKYGNDMQFAIRNNEGILQGCIGVVNQYDKGSHVEEIGYWIASHSRNKGLATKALKAFSRFMFMEMNYLRLEAIVFKTNEASQKVLLKAGFEPEGLLRKYVLKEGKPVDCKLYSLVN